MQQSRRDAPVETGHLGFLRRRKAAERGIAFHETVGKVGVTVSARRAVRSLLQFPETRNSGTFTARTVLMVDRRRNHEYVSGTGRYYCGAL